MRRLQEVVSRLKEPTHGARSRLQWVARKAAGRILSTLVDDALEHLLSLLFPS